MFIRSEKTSGWIFAFTINSVIPLVFSCLIFFLYVKILKIIKESETFSQDKFDSAYIMMLSLLAITISNLLGWIPVSILGLNFKKNKQTNLCLIEKKKFFFFLLFLGIISSLYDLYISDKNYFLIICTILPLNSFFNPIFYGIYDWRTFKIKQQKRMKTERFLISKKRNNSG